MRINDSKCPNTTINCWKKKWIQTNCINDEIILIDHLVKSFKI